MSPHVIVMLIVLVDLMGFTIVMPLLTPLGESRGYSLTQIGVLFGACTNGFSASDGQVVSVDHGCGAHSAVVEEEHVEELPALLWETIDWDQSDSLFD